MSVLIRLYPREWRDRYGEELASLLEERPPGLSDTVDLALGALDAHLHRRGPNGQVSAAGVPLTVRIGALAAMAGGAAWVCTFVLAVARGTRSEELAMLFLSLASLLFLVALAGLGAVRSRAHPVLVRTAFLLPALGVAAAAVGIVGQTLFGDRPIVSDLTPYAFWIVGTLLALAGCAMFALVSAATGALTRSSAWVLAAGAVVQLGTIFGTDHRRDEWLLIAGAVAFGLSWIMVGVAGSRAQVGPVGVADLPA